jgi:predicted flap endonuclease-1-like 5' DNA nuclease/predicted nuclease with TOPRIM domain
MRLLFPILAVVLVGCIVWMYLTGMVIEQPSILPISCAAALLTGYLAADSLLNQKVKDLNAVLDQRDKDKNTLSEQFQSLKKQSAMGVPHTEMEDLRLRLKTVEDEKAKIQADFIAHSTTISTLNNRLTTLKAAHEALKADADAAGSLNSEVASLQEALTEVREKLTAVASENDDLRDKVDMFEKAAIGRIANGAMRTAKPPVEPEAKSAAQSDFFVEDTGKPEVTSATVEPDLEITNDDLKLEEPTTNPSQTTEGTPQMQVSSAIKVTAPNNKEHTDTNASVTPKMTPDNLQAIEGIGPKVEQILKDGGVTTWKVLAETDIIKLRMILASAGDEYRLLDPTGWSAQAKMLMENDWEALRKHIEWLKPRKTKDNTGGLS